MLLSYKPLHLEAQQRLQEEGCVVDINYQVLSFLGNDSNVHENMMLPKLDTFVVLTNEGPGMDKRDEYWSKTKHEDDGMHKGIQNGVTSDDFRTLKPP